MIYPQMLLDVHSELIVDLFAGGGGASVGIEMALGRSPDVAVNHDPVAVAMHQANHPQTRHFVSDVFEVDPREVTGGRPVGLLWASPDCTYHSKARGGKPIRSASRKRRALAWVVTRWAGQVRPRVIALENVEEFAEWGPLVGPKDRLTPCPRRRGRTFRKWVRSLEALGYQVEWRELRACNYGAPTIRKRLFLIARCDGAPIVWPEPTHGPTAAQPHRTAAECIDWTIPMLSIFATRDEARAWAKEHGQGVPVRPLAEATLRRIARGVQRFVVDNPEPFIVPLTHHGERRVHPLTEAVPTVTAAQRGELGLVAPVISQLAHGEGSGTTRRWGVGSVAPTEPLPTILASGTSHALVAPCLVPNNTNNAPHSAADPVPTVTGGGRNILVAPLLTEHANASQQRVFTAEEPLRTQVASVKGGHFALAAATLVQTGYGEREGQKPRSLEIEAPLGTIVGGAAKHALVSAFLAQHNDGFYQGAGRTLGEPAPTICASGSPQGLVAASLTHFQTGEPVGGSSPTDPARAVLSKPKAGLVYSFLQKYYGQGIGQEVGEPAPTVTTKDRMGLVTVDVQGAPYVIADIAMRMLQPLELYRAQGFPAGYVIDRGADGRRLTKTEQVRMVGNSVCPPIAAALVRANVPEMIARDEVVKLVRRARRGAEVAA